MCPRRKNADFCIDCGAPYAEGLGFARDRCKRCYSRTRHAGALNTPAERRMMAERRAVNFWRKVRRGAPDECWPWEGNRRNGYGVFVFGRKAHAAHRFAFEVVHGDVPGGLGVLHSCDNPPCCNPAHLWAGTQIENIADRDAKGRSSRVPDGPRRGQYAITVGATP